MDGFRNRSRTDYIVIHCSLTAPNQVESGYKYLDHLHRLKGAMTCGYHWVIERSGDAIQARHLLSPGNHCSGINGSSVSICLIGGLSEAGEPEVNWTEEQWKTLRSLIQDLHKRYPQAEIVGHNDVAPKPTHCPVMDVRAWLRSQVRRKHLPKEVLGEDKETAQEGTNE